MRQQPVYRLAATGAIVTENIGHYSIDELIEELPTVATEGDTCTVHDGPYAYYYEWRAGRWEETGATAPWQLRVG